MPELPHMPFYPADWILDTQDLSPEAYTAYHRLICHFWLNRANGLPNDPAILCKRAGFSHQKWRYIWDEIEVFFHLGDDGLLHSKRLDKERVKSRSKYMARSKAGREGAKAKWRKTKKPGNGKGNGKPDGKQDSNHNHTDINISAREARGDFSDDDFKARGFQPLGDLSIAAIKDGKRFLLGNVTAAQAREAVERGVVTEGECRAVGIL